MWFAADDSPGKFAIPITYDAVPVPGTTSVVFRDRSSRICQLKEQTAHESSDDVAFWFCHFFPKLPE